MTAADRLLASAARDGVKLATWIQIAGSRVFAGPDETAVHFLAEDGSLVIVVGDSDSWRQLVAALPEECRGR